MPKITSYDPKTNKWSELSTLPLYLLAPMANVVDETLVVSGGARRLVQLPQCRTFLNESLLDVIKGFDSPQESLEVVSVSEQNIV